MAKVTGALMSVSASGTIGKRITFTQGKSGARAIAYAAPKNTGAPAHKENYRAGCATWKLLSEEQQAAWRITGQNRTINGFNAFMSAWLHGQITPATAWDAGGTTWDNGHTTWDFLGNKS